MANYLQDAGYRQVIVGWDTVYIVGISGVYLLPKWYCEFLKLFRTEWPYVAKGPSVTKEQALEALKARSWYVST